MDAYVPNVGIHRGIAADDYHAWDLCSSSRLRTLDALTPAHLRAELDARREDSAAMRMGTALHTLALEGEELFNETFHVGGPLNERTGAEYGSDSKAFRLYEQQVGMPILRTSEANIVRAMAGAIERNACASKLIDAMDERELSIVAEVCGVPCKGRLDGHGSGVVIDIKTTSRGAGPFDFQQRIATMGYGIQAALYWRLCMTVGLEVSDFSFICVETEPPHCVAVYRLLDDVVSEYSKRLPQLVSLYWACVKTGEWPGWPETVRDIGLPVYAQRRLEATNQREEA